MTPSPCTTCHDVARDCATCLPRLAWEGANLPPEPPRCAVCAEVDHFTLGGDDLWYAATRLGMQHASLVTHLRRHGRTDLLPKRVTL